MAFRVLQSCPGSVSEHPQAAPEVPQECLGSDQDSSGEAWESRQRRPGTLGDGPRQQKSWQSCIRVAQVVCKAFASQFLDKFRVFCKVCEPSEVLRLSAKTKVWPSTHQVGPGRRKNSKIHSKIDPKSVEIRPGKPLRVARASFLSPNSFNEEKKTGKSAESQSRAGHSAVGARQGDAVS